MLGWGVELDEHSTYLGWPIDDETTVVVPADTAYVVDALASGVGTDAERYRQVLGSHPRRLRRGEQGCCTIDSTMPLLLRLGEQFEVGRNAAAG